MSILRTSTLAIRKLSCKSRAGRRTYTQLSTPLLKVGQPTVIQNRNKSPGWAVPAMMAVVGLGVSTFCTHQLVTCSDSIKVFTTETPVKE